MEKASQIDYSNVEVTRVLNKVKNVARARFQGNDHFSSGRYSEACTAYGEGLKHDGSNSVLYCNRAVCWSKLGLWEQSVEDCNQALKIQPNYIKALLRRAVSNAKVNWHYMLHGSSGGHFSFLNMFVRCFLCDYFGIYFHGIFVA